MSSVDVDSLSSSASLQCYSLNPCEIHCSLNLRKIHFQYSGLPFELPFVSSSEHALFTICPIFGLAFQISLPYNILCR
ncbi:hypothetical protein GCWU000342_01573 [Shuttleworthella satelles DSM 14600]|uniref:Uncharacterized protein n=1 Tax=Shuttleworthella satelles DSM 14600 TaxID=626523 RepID=C4GC87_9FIRM|nr:hypothetical protein GCWU000342_01573 [Shuttleworthia satelles DSM 14600]